MMHCIMTAWTKMQQVPMVMSVRRLDRCLQSSIQEINAYRLCSYVGIPYSLLLEGTSRYSREDHGSAVSFQLFCSLLTTSQASPCCLSTSVLSINERISGPTSETLHLREDIDKGGWHLFGYDYHQNYLAIPCIYFPCLTNCSTAPISTTRG